MVWESGWHGLEMRLELPGNETRNAARRELTGSLR